MVLPRRSRRYRAQWSTRTYYEEGRHRRRAPLIVLGTGLIIGGALVAVHSLVAVAG